MIVCHQHSANIGPTSMRQQRYYNIRPTLDQHPCANSDITIFSQQWANVILYQCYIFQPSANIGPTSMRQQRYYNIQPTLDQHPYANSDIVPSTFNQHCTNVVMPTLYQHSANIGPTSMRQQRYYNIQPTLDQHPYANSDIVPSTFNQH